jgi:hypothetical protein
VVADIVRPPKAVGHKITGIGTSISTCPVKFSQLY